MDNNTIDRMAEDLEALISEMDDCYDDRFVLASELAAQLVDELKCIDFE